MKLPKGSKSSVLSGKHPEKKAPVPSWQEAKQPPVSMIKGESGPLCPEPGPIPLSSALLKVFQPSSPASYNLSLKPTDDLCLQAEPCQQRLAAGNFGG